MSINKWVDKKAWYMYTQWTFISDEEQNLICAAKWIELKIILY